MSNRSHPSIPPASAVDAVRAGAFEYAQIDRDAREKIGSGLTSRVYRQSHPETGESIAIKEPDLSEDESIQRPVFARYEREAEHWEALDDHANIVDLIDYGFEPKPWIAMEYLSGGTLEAYLGGLSPVQMVWTALQIVEGLHHAHDYGVAHLDLKPQNVIFVEAESGYWNVPKIGDWEFSRFLLKHSHGKRGWTPRYSAPEQLDSETFGELGKHTDIFQLGLMLYELFTGTHPFSGELAEITHQILHSEPAAPSDVSPTVPDELDGPILEALRKEPQDRPDDIAEIETRLSELFRDLTADVSTGAWTTARGGPANHGRTTEPGPDSGAAVEWTRLTGDGVFADPVAYPERDQVIVSSRDGTVSSLNIASGTATWMHATRTPHLASPAVTATDDGTALVLVGDGDGEFLALDADTGEKRWSESANQGFTAGVNVFGGRAYVGSEDGCLYAYDVSDEEQKDKYQTSRWISATAAIGDGAVFVGNWQEELFALEIETGRVRRLSVEGNVVSAPVKTNRGVLVTTDEGQIALLDGSLDDAVWKTTLDDSIGVSPAVDEDTLYVVCEDDTLYALDLDTGSERWSVATQARVRTAPVLSDGTVYVGDDDGYLSGFEASTADEKWSVYVGSSVVSGPLLYGDRIVVGTEGGQVVALR
jgi:outer membrane protein assembly factor BamB